MKALCLAFAVLCVSATAGTRSHQAVAEFKRGHPCPTTGAARGPCRGWIVDHVKPLCAGGADHPSNMQWQTVADAKRKDADERRLCRNLKR